MAPAQVRNLPTGAVLHLTDFHVRGLYVKAGTCWMGLTVRLIEFYFQGLRRSTILPGVRTKNLHHSRYVVRCIRCHLTSASVVRHK
jgi:hypothetical protein